MPDLDALSWLCGADGRILYRIAERLGYTAPIDQFEADAILRDFFDAERLVTCTRCHLAQPNQLARNCYFCGRATEGSPAEAPTWKLADINNFRTYGETLYDGAAKWAPHVSGDIDGLGDDPPD